MSQLAIAVAKYFMAESPDVENRVNYLESLLLVLFDVLDIDDEKFMAKLHETIYLSDKELSYIKENYL